jgi:hypothetical protein
MSLRAKRGNRELFITAIALQICTVRDCFTRTSFAMTMVYYPFVIAMTNRDKIAILASTLPVSFLQSLHIAPG